MSDCLYCRFPDARMLRVEQGDEFIVETMRCMKCHKTWKDFKGNSIENSPILSIQRQKSEPDNKSLSE